MPTTIINTDQQRADHVGFAGNPEMSTPHLQHVVSPNAYIPYPGDPGLADPWPIGWNTIEDFERYEADAVVDPDDYYGFGHIELTRPASTRHTRCSISSGSMSTAVCRATA